MARIFEDNSRSIGNTPLVRLNRLTQGLRLRCWPRSRAEPSYYGSVRIGASMIWDAEERVWSSGRRDRRAHERQYRDRLGYVCAARGTVDADHAGDDEPRTASSLAAWARIWC